MEKTTKRKKKKNVGLWILCLCAVAFCLWLFSTFTLKTTKAEIVSSKVKEEITIVQLSDLHGFSFGINNSSLIKRIEKENPDFIAVTGDMYTYQSEEGKTNALKLMKRLAERYMVYYVNGEHDNDEEFNAQLKSFGVHVLDYMYEDVRIGSTDVRIYGINNVYYSPTFDLKNEFEINRSKYNILLAHVCNKEAFADFGMDLCICGDTHGGQIRLPFVGGVYGTSGWFPEIKDKNVFIKGAYKYGDTDFFISSGLGNYPLPVRFLNRPEVAVIKVTPEN